MSERRRFAILPRLGIRPALGDVVRETLDAAFARAEGGRPADPGGRGVTVLDAGCGGSGFLVRYAPRIGCLAGLDIHAPAGGAPNHLDTFVEADMCRQADAFAPASFDVVMSKFTVEHLADPCKAFAAIRGWLRPGGTLILVTVNRRHPLVAAYLDLPCGPRVRLQRLVKASDDDAFLLVGACNDPGSLRRALASAGFEAIDVRSVGHLARAWGRWLPGYLLGLAGDIAAQHDPRRRSTLVITARAPAA